MKIFDTIIQQEELIEIIDSDQLTIIDCRHYLTDTQKGRNEYHASHIPHAVFAHLDEDLSGKIIPGITGRHPFPDQDVLLEKCESWGISEGSQVVVYDQSHGGIAARLWCLLHWIGHAQVAVLNGGWKHWQSKGQPVSDVQEKRKPSSLKLRTSLIDLVHAEQIEQEYCTSAKCLIDARSTKRYQGIEEPIDPVAGHIPTAVNHPFLENVNEAHLWKSQEDITQRFTHLFEQFQPSDIAVYCGSGVTACHNILAMKYAGFPLPKLYPGSWSDWITDVQRTIG